MCNIDFLGDEEDYELGVDPHARPEEEHEEDYEDGFFIDK